MHTISIGIYDGTEWDIKILFEKDDGDDEKIRFTEATESGTHIHQDSWSKNHQLLVRFATIEWWISNRLRNMNMNIVHECSGYNNNISNKNINDNDNDKDVSDGGNGSDKRKQKPRQWTVNAWFPNSHFPDR